jgi:5-methylthioadenosine/S-adenosylhomocysteine deaminase
VVLLKRDSYALAARNDLTVQLVYAENGSSVDQVFVDGELVVEHGHCTRVDEREIFRQVGAARAALQAGLEAEQAASAAVEDPIREMMERVAGWPLDMRPGAWFA